MAPSSIPGGTLSSIRTLDRSSPFPPQVGHGSKIRRPVPWHRGHSPIEISCVNPRFWTRRTWPRPPHSEHVSIAVLYFAPVPRQSAHGADRGTSTVGCAPVTAAVSGRRTVSSSVAPAGFHPSRAHAELAAKVPEELPEDGGGAEQVLEIADMGEVLPGEPAGTEVGLDSREPHLVVLTAASRRRQDLVGLGDLLELLLSDLLALLRNVRVMLSGEAAIRGLHLVRAGGPRASRGPRSSRASPSIARESLPQADLGRTLFTISVARRAPGAHTTETRVPVRAASRTAALPSRTATSSVPKLDPRAPTRRGPNAS